MIQTQWPGLGPNFDLASLDGAAGGGPALWPNETQAGAGATAAPGADAIGRSWWSCGTANANGGALSSLLGGANGNSSSLFGMVSGLVSALQQLVGALLNGATNPTGTATPSPWQAQTQPNAAAPWQAGTPWQTSTPWQTGTPQTGAPWQNPVPGGPEQRFADVDVSSTGDPHIAETGTRANGTAVNARWDSMTAHDDLVHTDQVEGGYRVSTTVTQPDANGVTYNQSASVHANFGQDDVTLNRDGSYQIFSDGRALALGKGESATLSGGERVDVAQDGSISVLAANGSATVATTLRSTGAGVDVTTHGHGIALGGDAVTHARGAHAAPAP
ncbi:MAG TPA: hypothetical protein VHT53_00145 [Candidatus Elarobacter sp.]|nr:hypothetical protein [Candidatus Elarobacter sp.]